MPLRRTVHVDMRLFPVAATNRRTAVRLAERGMASRLLSRQLPGGSTRTHSGNVETAGSVCALPCKARPDCDIGAPVGCAECSSLPRPEDDDIHAAVPLVAADLRKGLVRGAYDLRARKECHVDVYQVDRP